MTHAGRLALWALFYLVYPLKWVGLPRPAAAVLVWIAVLDEWDRDRATEPPPMTADRTEPPRHEC